MTMTMFFCFVLVVSPDLTDGDLGFSQSKFTAIHGRVNEGQNFTDLLMEMTVNARDIAALVKAAKPIFDAHSLHPNHFWWAYFPLSEKRPRYFVYQESPQHLILFQLSEPVGVYRRSRETTGVERTARITVEKSLYEALEESGHPTQLAMGLRDMFYPEINLGRLRKGDAFHFIYEEKQVAGQPVGIGPIQAACFTHRGKAHYRFLVEEQVIDEQGFANVLPFLTSPLKRGVLSSPYTKKRFHPVLKRYTPHFGTDFSAPRGTPVLALAKGVVTEASYDRYNGNFVKIRHNSTYDTQYLHMVRKAKNIRPGTSVKQGQVIGYVGNTGLAAGNHVCLRFWKNGRQVDFRKQRFTTRGRVKYQGKDSEIKQWKRRLDALSVSGRKRG